MATKEKDQKENLEAAENQENPEEEKEEEEEPVDLELQKEMKGLKISDSDFGEKPKTKKVNKKAKNAEDKKSKKKGLDFIDYANKNNIEINLEYEENKYQLKKKDEQKFGDKKGNKYYDKKQNNKGGYKNDMNHQQPKQIYTGNKFDNIELRPFVPKSRQNPPPKLDNNKAILEYLQKIFSEESINRINYIRNRLKHDKILIDDMVEFYDIKSNKIDSQKIIDVIKDSQTLEYVNEDNKNYIKIKNFDQMKILSNIDFQNKKGKRPKMNYMPMGQQYFFPPYNPYMMQGNYYMGDPSSMYNNPNQFYPSYPVEADNK